MGGADPLRVLVVNAGSSSLKFAVRDGEDRAPEVAGSYHLRDGRVKLKADAGPLPRDVDFHSASERFHDDALRHLIDALASADVGLDAVGHRLVHGGRRFVDPVRLDEGVVAELKTLVPLAPLHLPSALEAIDAVTAAMPSLVQVGVFDTGFHQHMPEMNRLFALPYDLAERGILRYGFHGIAYASVLCTLRDKRPDIADGRLVLAHLGSGASLCAVQGGRSVDSTMGFSALDGLPMSTRCGALDPGVVLYLMQSEGMTAPEVETLLYERAGLLGLSGLSGDVRTLTEAGTAPAERALTVFAAAAAKSIAAMATSLGGLDGIAFSGGVGEHEAGVRGAIAERLGWLGVGLDAGANAKNAFDIHAAASDVPVFVVAADEQTLIDRDVRRLLAR